MTPPQSIGGKALVTQNDHAPLVRNADVSLNKVDDGSDPAASPWRVMGGLKGMGENLGAAIFN